MKIARIVRYRFQYALALAVVVHLTACHSSDRDQASQMTSFSANASKSATPQLFTIPDRPDVARAGGHSRADDDEAHPSAYGQRGVQRL